jgi:signal transduction histidine kinase
MEKEKIKESIELFQSEIFYLLTHELKTPLSAIMNFAELIGRILKTQKVDDETIKRVIKLSGYIYANSYTLKFFVENLLSLQKLKLKKSTFTIENVKVVNLIKQTLPVFKLLFGKKASISADNPNITVSGDKHFLKIILDNLLNNAFKYSQSTVLVSVKDEGENVFICVEDDGPGIKESEEKKIFELFERGSTSASGTGVGLYLVKTFCDIFGYEILVGKSEKLGGARFCLRIPKSLKINGLREREREK